MSFGAPLIPPSVSANFLCCPLCPSLMLPRLRNASAAHEQRRPNDTNGQSMEGGCIIARIYCYCTSVLHPFDLWDIQEDI